jgi:hypothetical protein
MEVCNRSAYYEGINGRQPHNLSIFVLLAAPTRSAHGRAGATGSVRHKRVRCNSDIDQYEKTPDSSTQVRDLRGPVSDDNILSWTRGKMNPNQRDPMTLAARFIAPPMTTLAAKETAPQRQIPRPPPGRQLLF